MGSLRAWWTGQYTGELRCALHVRSRAAWFFTMLRLRQQLVKAQTVVEEVLARSFARVGVVDQDGVSVPGKIVTGGFIAFVCRVASSRSYRSAGARRVSGAAKSTRA